MTDVYLNRIGTSVPPHDVHDAFVRFAATLLPDERMQRLFQRMGDRCGIEHRYSTVEPLADLAGFKLDQDNFYRRGKFPSSAGRMSRYEQSALPLALEAVARLEIADRLDEISHVIVTSCTGFYAPGLDLQLVQALGLRSSVERTVIGFMGCYAAFNALKAARHIVRSEPASRVLLVNLELCTLHLQETVELEQMLSFLVFADGCAASLVSAEPTGLRLDSFHAEFLPETAELITWRIGDNGFDMVLSGAVPGAVGAGLTQAAPRILDRGTTDGVDLWAVHPGGRSVLDAVQNALKLPEDALAHSRAVLRSYGNMSSATILFVLARMMRAGQSGAAGVAMSFGPGLVAETMRFRVA
ncbi:type III polyketide synthase [Lichenicola sp.]|uniref:type III polyketide synthase n=1 Tax=Lichenicola sp. TaxID=2804529 RepID=UPI003B00AB6F